MHLSIKSSSYHKIKSKKMINNLFSLTDLFVGLLILFILYNVILS